MRKFVLGFVLVTAFIVAACGRQVTPNPPGFAAGGAAPGFSSVTFDVAGTMNFSTYQYWIVFDTSGDGLTPTTTPAQNNWAGYSSGIEVGGSQLGTAAYAFQIVKQPGQQAAFYPLHLTSQQMQYIPNSNGSGSEFTVIFQRSAFTPTIGPSPLPLARVWTYNGFTTQGAFPNAIFVDSMGAGGPQNPQYTSPSLDTYTCFDNPYTALYSGQQIDPNAQISQITIANNPSPVPSPAPTVTPCS